MRNGNDTRPEHPEDLLAGYVDGSASPEERSVVQEHLSRCSQCRDEVALANAGRTALMSLPQLDAPELSPQVIAGLVREASPESGSDDLAERRQAKRERQLRRWQGSWISVAGVAAVVALLAIIPFALSRSGGGSGRTAGGAAAPRPEAQATPRSYPSVYDLGSNYDAASIRTLAKSLAAKVASDRAKALPANARATPSPLPPEGSFGVASVAPAEVVQCALRGTGLPGNTSPLYLETAKFQGKPAYVIAVLAQGENKAHLRVYTVSQQGCQFLFEADQPL
jgi:anti-sigma factor RsiW